MRSVATKWKFILGTGAALAVAVSCSEVVTSTEDDGNVSEAPALLTLEKNSAPFDLSDGFTPVASSSACTVGGGLEQLVLPAGFVSTLVGSEPAFPDLGDMNTVNESGRDAGRFLYRTHELGSGAGISVTDLETGASRLVASRADWERFDGLVWTPWKTLITGEEINPDPLNRPDPDFPAATAGLAYEIDPLTGVAHARPALGVKSHEGFRFDGDGNLYSISERTPGFIFKFVPDRHGNLSSGKLYALRLVSDEGDRTGWAEWALLDRAQVQINADAAAEAVGATGYNRPEDVETDQSTGKVGGRDKFLYVAITGEDRVLAINLDAGKRGRDNRGRVLVSDYVRDGVNAPADFDFPDNLALDQDGNLFITEDPGGTAPSKTRGDDVWVTRFDPANPSRGRAVERFLSITDCNAEPTGIYFSKSGHTLFVNVQHRGGDGRDGDFAIQKISQVDLKSVSR